MHSTQPRTRRRVDAEEREEEEEKAGLTLDITQNTGLTKQTSMAVERKRRRRKRGNRRKRRVTTTTTTTTATTTTTTRRTTCDNQNNSNVSYPVFLWKSFQFLCSWALSAARRGRCSDLRTSLRGLLLPKTASRKHSHGEERNKYNPPSNKFGFIMKLYKQTRIVEEADERAIKLKSTPNERDRINI